MGGRTEIVEVLQIGSEIDWLNCFVTASFLLSQQHITYPACSIFKANLQKGHSLKALHWICTCKADPADICQILEKHQCLSLKKIRWSRWERSSGIVDLWHHCCLTLILRKHMKWMINYTLCQHLNNDMETCRSPPGFVKKKSCQTNLISFCDRVTDILDRGET